MKALIVVVLILAGAYWLFTHEKPGTGLKARAGMKQAQPIIAALENLRQARGGYPVTLDDLAPEYLPTAPRRIDEHPIDYELKGMEFELTFSYTSPLPTHCTYSPTRRWKCAWF